MNKIFAAAVLGIAFTSLQVNAHQGGGDLNACSKCVKTASSACTTSISHTTCLQLANKFCQDIKDCAIPAIPLED